LTLLIILSVLAVIGMRFMKREIEMTAAPKLSGGRPDGCPENG